ncbi:hypothetical protein EON65_26455 [archaeon]|nr:MAG: hypothetical protein EON65_26455 [archaeon]
MASTKLSSFKRKCMSQVHSILHKQRTAIDDAIDVHNANIKSLDKEQQALKKQVDAAESAIKERINKENMIKQVVESRFKSSIQQLSEHIETQTGRYNAQLEAYNRLIKQQAYVRGMYEEINNKRQKVDPFLRKRASNMVKGLMQTLDERAIQIQKAREEEIMHYYKQVIASRKDTREMKKEHEFLEVVYKDIQEKVKNHEQKFQQDREFFREKAKVIRMQAEDMEMKLTKMESTLHERARAERRQSHLHNKAIALKSENGGEKMRDVLSNEEYIDRLLQIYQKQHPSSAVLKGDMINRRTSTRKSRFLPTLRSSRNLDLQASDSDSDSEGAKDKRRNSNAPKMLPLVDDITEDKLGFTANEEKRRNMVQSNLQPVAVIHQNHQSANEVNQVDSFEPEDMYKISLTILSDSSSEEETAPDEKKRDVEAEECKIDLSKEGSRTSSAGLGNKVVQNTTPSNVLAVQSEMCTACYAHVFQQHSLHTSQAALRRLNPRLKNSAAITPKRNVIEFGTDAETQGRDHTRTSTYIAQLNNRYTNSRISPAYRLSSREKKKEMLIDENSFQFSVGESVHVLLEIVEQFKSWSLLDLVASVNMLKELHSLLRTYHKYNTVMDINSKTHLLKGVPEEIMRLYLDSKLTLHTLCLKLLKGVDEKGIKVCYVTNKKAFFVEVYHSVLAIVAIFTNVTVPPSLQISQVPLMSSDWLENLNKQAVFIVLGGYHLLVEQKQSRTTSKARQAKVVKMAVRKFSTLLVQNSRGSQAHDLLNANEAEITPYDVTSHLLNLAKTCFNELTSSLASESISVAHQQQLDNYASYIQLLQRDMHRLLSEIEQKHTRTSTVYELEHYVCLHLFEVFFYLLSLPSLPPLEKCETIFQAVLSYGRTRHLPQSAYIVENQYVSLGIKDFDSLYSPLSTPTLLPSILLLYLLKEVVYYDLRKRILMLSMQSGFEEFVRGLGSESLEVQLLRWDAYTVEPCAYAKV